MIAARHKYSEYYLTASSWILIILWIYAAVSKLSDMQEFRTQLGQSPLLTPYTTFTSWFIPLVELLLAILLFTDRFRRPGLYGSFSLMIMFTAYIIVITGFSYFIPCSCGGILGKMTWNQHLIFNIGIVLLAAIAIVCEQSSGRNNLLQQNRESRKPE